MLEIKDLQINLKGIKIQIPYLEVNDGDYLTIMGTTGAGKTVLVETIAGFHRPDRGEIILNGENIVNKPPNKRKIAIVYQDFMLFPHMSVEENILYPLKLRKMDEREAIRIAKMLEIENLLSRNPKTLSGGEMQRVAIARALVLHPSLLLLDEPFSSVDKKTKEKLRGVVKNTVEELGTTVIHITHDMETALLMGNKIAMMHNGKLMQVGSVEEVLSRPNPEFVAEFVDTNILRGEVIGEKDGLTEIAVGAEKIYTSEQGTGKVLLSIRPENIIIAKSKIKSSMRNSLRGVIERMEAAGTVVRISLRFRGFTLVSVLTPNAIHALSLREGDEVFVYFKASSVRVL